MKTKPLNNLLAGASLCIAMLGSGPLHADTGLSVVTYGGAFENAVQEAYFKPFSQKTGIDFNLESYDGGLAKLAAMVQAGNTTWDVIDLESTDAIAACDEGLLMTMDVSILGDTSDYIPGSISDCAVASMIWSTIFAYDKDKLANGRPISATSLTQRSFRVNGGCARTPRVLWSGPCWLMG